MLKAMASVAEVGSAPTSRQVPRLLGDIVGFGLEQGERTGMVVKSKASAGMMRSL
jgi:hypothetical protein